MDTVTGYKPNRVSSSVFFRKPVNSMELRLVSKEPIFSLQTGNVSLSKEHRFIGLAAALKLDKKPKLNTPVNQVTKTNPVKDSQTSKSDEVKREEPDGLSKPAKQIIGIEPVYPCLLVKESLDSEIDDNDDESKPDDECKPVDQITETKSISPVKELFGSESKPDSVNQITEIKPDSVLHPVENFENSKISDLISKQEDELEENKPDNVSKPVNQITEIELVPPPPVKKSHSEIEEHKISDPIDYQEDDVNEIKPEESQEPVKQITKIKPVPIFPRNSEIEEVKDRISDTSNSSNYSFEFPILHSEYECVKPKELSLFQTQTKTRTQPKCRNSKIHAERPRRKQSLKKTSQTQSLICYWFSCFNCPYNNQRDRRNRQFV